MLLSIEVAVEYWLALTWCPQAQWLNDAAQKGQLQDEVRSLWSIACLHFLQAASADRARSLHVICSFAAGGQPLGTLGPTWSSGCQP